VDDPRLIIGHEAHDDAGVYLVREDLAMIQSIDVFGPVVDDPYLYGQIAAANALSDIYAMGAVPSTAVAFAAFPKSEAIPDTVLGDILRGGADKVAEAGALMLGGHSIRDKEPKYGLCVTAFAHPDAIVTNAGAQRGDALILTKPLGSGILTSALKRGQLDAATRHAVTKVMVELNRSAAEAAMEVGVHAMTDVTGFGLLGHLGELCLASHVNARIQMSSVPLIPGARQALARGGCPAGTKRNLSHVQSRCRFEGCGDDDKLLLADAQTSGGLLIAVSEDRTEALLQALDRAGVEGAARVGSLSGEDEAFQMCISKN
jgi:selenide, water dikinase